MTPNVTEEPTNTTTPSTTTTTSSSSNTTSSSPTPNLRPSLPTLESPSPCCSQLPPTSPDPQTCSPGLSSSTSASSLHPHVGSKMGYAILAIILILGWVTVMALLIFKEMWQLVLLGWLLFYAAAHFCYWFYKRNTSVTLQQQLRLRLVSHFRPGSPFKPNDHPPAYDDVMKSEPPPPSYFSVISEVPSCSYDPPPAYPSPARPARRVPPSRRIPPAGGSISALPPPIEVEAQPKVLVSARPSSSSSSSTTTAISYLSSNSSTPVHSPVQRSVSQFCDDMTSELRQVGTTGADDVVVHISSSPAEDAVENDENAGRRGGVLSLPQGSAPSSASLPHRGGVREGSDSDSDSDSDGDTVSSDTSSNTSSGSSNDSVVKVSSECITLEEYELRNSANGPLVCDHSLSDSTNSDRRPLESTSDGLTVLTDVTDKYSQSEARPPCTT